MLLRRLVLLLLPCAAAVGGTQTFPLRGHWIADAGAPLVLNFRTADIVWTVVPAAMFGAYGTYRYANGQLVIQYQQSLPDSSAVTLHGDTLVAEGPGVWTATRIAPARGGRSEIHGTWASAEEEGQIRLLTLLPSGQAFSEGALPGHYTISGGIVTIAGDTAHGNPSSIALRIQVEGTDTVLAQIGGNSNVFRRPKCRTDPRLRSGVPFTSACS